MPLSPYIGLQTWDIERSPSARAMPAILEVSPPVLLASQPDLLRVSGLNMLQNDCQLLLRLQGRYVQPTSALCGDCSCLAPVHPASSTAGPSSQGAASEAASSFEQRCCGCCTSKLQLVGLLPPTPPRSPPPAQQQPAARLPTPTSAAGQPPPSCCQQRAAAVTAAPAAASAPTAAAGPSCCEATPAPTQELVQALALAGGGGSASPAAARPAGRRVSAGGARVQSLRLRLPAPQQQEEAMGAVSPAALLPGLLHLDICCRTFTAPRGEAR